MSIFDSPDEAHKLYLALGEYVNRYGLNSTQVHTEFYAATVIDRKDNEYETLRYRLQSERENSLHAQCIPSFVGCIKR